MIGTIRGTDCTGDESMKVKLKTTQRQMSESFWTITFLTFSGGLQDVYTYFERGKVFANAMTGNLVLMSAKLFELNWPDFIHYLIPVLSFAFGIVVAQLIRLRFQHSKFHWRQMVVLTEILLLLVVPFIERDLLANSLVTFSCALQVQSFRKFHGVPFSSTMCIGNMRGGTDALISAIQTRSRPMFRKAMNYYRVILIFFLGAGVGRILCFQFGQKTIWFSCALLFCSLLVMCFHPDVLNQPQS